MKFGKNMFLVASILLFSYVFGLPSAQAAHLVDLEDHWAKSNIEKVLNLGIAGGYPDQFFGPDQLITRAEFIKILVKAGWVRPVINKNEQPAFQDVGWEHWASPYLEAAAALGIVAGEGSPDRYFKPERVITRAEMAAMSGRLLAVEHLPGVIATEAGLQKNWMAAMKNEGIICGYPDGSLGENSGLTRAEACSVVLRLKERLLAVQADRERQWINTAQGHDGYIAMAGDRPDIIPYFGNLTGMAQLDQPEDLAGVKKYLEWNFANLNYPDRWGLNGTIYDYSLKDGVARSVYDYDSADSYAATLLSLAAGYYLSSGDLNFIREHYRDLSTVSEVITTLQDSDGLIWVKPSLQFKYLMDNCECYRGLKDWSDLLAELGYKEWSGLYAGKAELIKQGILEQLWDDQTASFAWAVDHDGSKYLSSPGKSYPGLFAQIYPVTFGVISPASEKAGLAYQKLNEELPRWAELEVGDPFPWAILGYAAVIMEDLARADRFLENCRFTYISRERPYPWSTFESAFYVRACDELRENIRAGFN